MLNAVDGEQRQTYYTNSSQIGDSSGCVFLDTFTKTLDESSSDPQEDKSVAKASSLIALEIYTKSGETLAFSIDSSQYIDDAGDPDADKYFDDAENIVSAIKEEYQKLLGSGFTTATVTDDEIAEMADVFARVSSFTHYNQQDYYGENNLGRYELSSGMVVDMMHQEMVVTTEYSASSGTEVPDNWTASTPISSLSGFSKFTNAGFDSIIDLPTESTVDDDSTDDSGSTGDTDSSDGTGSTGDSGSTDGTDSTDETSGTGEEEESPYHIEDDPIIEALFNILSENQSVIGYGSAAETDFKDLIKDFNNEIAAKETVSEAKSYYDSVMPYIAELTGLLEEPASTESIFKSIDVIFDVTFTQENYSVVDTGSDEINDELYNMRGNVDYYLEKMKNLKKEMDQYNDDNPLDAGSTEVDPIWEEKLDRMHSYTAEFFGKYGPVGSTEFVDSKLAPIEENTDDSVVGPDEGVLGDLYNTITKYPNGIPLDSPGQVEVYEAVRTFQKTIYQMKIADYSDAKMKEEFDSALPYLNEAITLLNDVDAVEESLSIINDTFMNTFLELDSSVPESYEKEFFDMISQQRGGMNDSLDSVRYYRDRINEAIMNNEPEVAIDSYTASLDSAVESFIESLGVPTYEGALFAYRESLSDEEEE